MVSRAAIRTGSTGLRSRTLRSCPRPTTRRYATQFAPATDRKLPTTAILPLKPSPYGQPMYPSHPHLMKPREITPGISAKEYERRRRALMDSLPENSLVVCVAGQIKYMSGQIFYKYRQSSDFWYLTGFNEPGCALVLEKSEKSASTPRGFEMTLFSGGTDPTAAQWDGARMSFDDVKRHLQADDARPVDEFPDALRALAPTYDHIYMDVPASSTSKRNRPSSPKSLLKYLTLANSSRTDHGTLLDSFGSGKRKPLAPEVGKLRAIKSEAEQAVMHAGADISARAHAKTMRHAQPGMSEHVLAAHFEYMCAREGSQRPAYVPVVASGPNALTIHYTANDQLIRDGELILVDAGCEYNGYASDITRTFPASGKFTSAQADLYGAVLAAQKQLVALCTEISGYSLAQLHWLSCDYLRKELEHIGLPCTGGGALSELYPHYLGHPVGVDLHESTHFERNESMKAGMVITIEPGIYVPPSPAYPIHFHNIGVRIEDEVLVGKKHPIILSANAPKEIVDVEGACQGLLGLEAF